MTLRRRRRHPRSRTTIVGTSTSGCRAGSRYTNSFTRLELTSADSKVNQAAAQLVAAANQDLRDLLERLIHGALDPNRPPIPFPPLGQDEKLRLLRFIRDARRDPVTA